MKDVTDSATARMVMNDANARSAGAALVAYRKFRGFKAEELEFEELAKELISDIIHLCDRNDVQFVDLQADAVELYAQDIGEL